MKKVKKFYSLKSLRNDKAGAKKFGEILDKIIFNQNRFRELIHKYYCI